MLEQFLLSPLCLHCGSLSLQKSLFCADCYHCIISPKILKNSEYFENNQHIFLIPWQLGDYECVNQLVYRLKNLQSEEALKFYVQFLIKILKQLKLQKAENILVPIPSSRKRFNHSHSIAKLLSEEGFGMCADILSKKSSGQQKHLSRSLRAENSFLLKPECEDFTHKLALQTKATQQVLFIDDVLTTGESFKRCSEVLGVAKKPLCVTLFYREKAE